MAKLEVPTKEKATSEARALCFKLLLCPDKFTLLEMARLQELMKNEGYMD